MGGRQLDFALKKVTFSDSPSKGCSRLLFDHFWPSHRVNFSGSMRGCGSLALTAYSLRGESLKFLVLEEETMISVSCWSWVEGKSSRNSFLQFLVAVASLRALSTGKASRLGSSRVSNLRLYSLPPLALPALTGSCSSKYPKKEVFSGLQCSRSDSAFLWCSWSVSLREGGCRAGFYRFWKKSLGSLLLLILMRLGLPLGSLKRWLLSAPLALRSPDQNSEMCLRSSRFSRMMRSRQSICLQLFYSCTTHPISRWIMFYYLLALFATCQYL